METSKIAYLNQDDIKSLALSIAEIIESAESGFVKLGNGRWKCLRNQRWASASRKFRVKAWKGSSVIHGRATPGS